MATDRTEGNQSDRQEAESGSQRPHKIFDASGQMIFRNPPTALALIQQSLRDAGHDDLAEVFVGAKLVEISPRIVKKDMTQGQSDIVYEVTTCEENPSVFIVVIEVKGGYTVDLPLQMGSDYCEIAKAERRTRASKAFEAAKAKKAEKAAGTTDAREESEKLEASDSPVLQGRYIPFGLLIAVNLGPGTLEGSPTSMTDMTPGYEDFAGKKIGVQVDPLVYDAIAKPQDELAQFPDEWGRGGMGVHNCHFWRAELGEEDLVNVFRCAGLPDSECSDAVANLAFMLYDEDDLEPVNGALVRVGYRRKKVASIADRWKSEGEAKGLVETLLLQVKQKFTGVSTQHEDQVRSASLEQLKDWLSRLLEAPDLETLFGASGGSRSKPLHQG